MIGPWEDFEGISDIDEKNDSNNIDEIEKLSVKQLYNHEVDVVTEFLAKHSQMVE